MLTTLPLFLALQAAAESPVQPSVVQRTHVVQAYACFAPDGESIVFQSNATGNWDLYSMRLDGSGLRAIVASAGADITPVFSPDGSKLVFVSERDGQREVYICDRDGGAQRRVTNDPGHDLHPVWSPNGERLLFSSNRGNASPDDYDLYSMRIDGSDLVRITSGPDVDTYASWSPEGRRLAVTRCWPAARESAEICAIGVPAAG